ncbi:ParA family protein [Loktanella sp. M215]|uniref:ParA family protein n=1 Tax=Loktanella sp. M215 TaxID=2675431 RepID=UPI001F1F2384|nr:ParA family protein [Loktanella sp. M215]MCF7702191.1 AAA family ATPase [Loktanella sp. M215]
MSVITFANFKGGAGKTTAALLLASELASRKAEIVIIDADPGRWISHWGALPGKPDNIRIITNVVEDDIVQHIYAAASQTQFVIIDLEATASTMTANAIGMSDLVVIPTQGGSMDTNGAAKTVRLIHNQKRVAQRSIAHGVLMTRTSAAVASRSFKSVRAQMIEAGITLFSTPIVERAAYRDIFDYGGLLRDLPTAQVSNLENACKNAQSFTAEVLSQLKAGLEQRGSHKVKRKRAASGSVDDLAGFRPRDWPIGAPVRKPPKVQAAENPGFRSRRTGRTAQLNLKARPDTIKEFCDLADSNGWGLGETLEYAVCLLQRDYGKKIA